MDRPDMTSRANSGPQPGAAPQQPLGAPRAYQTPTPPNPFHRIGCTEDDAPTGPIPRIPLDGAPIDTGPLRRVPIDRAATQSGPLPRVPVDRAPTNTDPFRRIRGQQVPSGQAPNPQGARQTGPIPRIPIQEGPPRQPSVPHVSMRQAPTAQDDEHGSLTLPEPIRQVHVSRNPSPPAPAVPRPPAPQDPSWHAPVAQDLNRQDPNRQGPIQRDPMRQNPIHPSVFDTDPTRQDPNHYAPDPYEQDLVRHNPIQAADGESAQYELDYGGDWSEWVEELPAEPKPTAPDYFRHEEALAAMIDRSGRNRSKRRWMPVLVGSVAAAGLLVVAFVQIQPEPQPATVASSTPSQVAVSGSTSAAQCPAERVGDTITGNGAGGLDSGPGVIFAFQYAYYVTRSGVATREFVAPNASVSPAGTIQQGIDGIPAGTTHCISITPGAFAGQYLVQVTEHRPDSTSITYKPQVVTTARVGNQTLITGIGAA
ncbi:hypothetical protein [Nocardia sp. NPDC049526]|uniref:hypothetical protein n=1 Tax=Nocardia sp. NPDC049526 TaxID=3364316 RepID=UPI0037A6F89E